MNCQACDVTWFFCNADRYKYELFFFKFHINNKFAHNLPIINKSTFIYSSQSQKQLSIIGYFREIT